jgi:hypothetical protein
MLRTMSTGHASIPFDLDRKESAVINKYAVITLFALLVVSTKPLQAAAPETPALKPIVVGDISYVIGGVGDTEELAMQGLAHDYRLLLAFTGSEIGNYIAGVQVTLADQSGRALLDVRSDGPCFFAKLPPGHYSLVANYQGQVQKRSIEIRDHEQSAMVLRWQLPKEQKTAEAPGEAKHLARGCWR